MSTLRFVALVVAGGLLAACRDGAREAPAESGIPAGPRRYSVRGEVLHLPEPGVADFTVRHEAVPDFVGIEGRVVGMESMAMSFPLAASASTRGLSVGDKIAFVLAVDWAKPSIAIERIERLPPETVLDFRTPRREVPDGRR
jgi:hypothetical protein